MQRRFIRCLDHLPAKPNRGGMVLEAIAGENPRAGLELDDDKRLKIVAATVMREGEKQTQVSTEQAAKAREVCGRTADGAEQTSLASKDLSRLAAKLLKTTNQFKV